MDYRNAPLLSAREAFEPAEQASLRTIARRTIIGGAAAAAFGIMVDQKVTDAKWRQHETTLQVFDTKGVRNGNATFVVPGLGVQSGEGIMNALMPAFQLGQFAGFIRYSDDALEVERIPDLINRAQHKLGFNGITLYLHSMAGSMAPDILDGLDDSVTVNRIDYNCSPWTAGFVYDEDLVNIISKLPVEGTYGTKLLAQVIDRFGRSQYEHLSMKQKLEVVWRITNDEGSPKTWLQQLQYLADRDIKRYDSMPESIPSAFLTPEDLSSDNVVELHETIDVFTKSIPGIKQVVPVSCRGHANPRQYPHAYIEAMAPLAEVFDSTDPIIPRHRGSLSFNQRNV